MAKTYRVTPFARFGNTMSGLMISIGLGPKGMKLLTVPGRKSGIPRTTPVNTIETNGTRWLVAPYGEVGWVLNARAAGVVTLRRGKKIEELKIREAPPEEAAPVLQQ